ncbi:MAG: cyclic pyranopterin monophosphate synthase MoaC [Caldisericaceae bacterium]
MSQFDEFGKVSMVNVSEKPETFRTAKAQAVVFLREETLSKILNGEVKKGDVLSTAKIAGIMAAKKTHELIPLCHPLNITFVDVKFTVSMESRSVKVEGYVEMYGKTGAEMEALTSVSVAALTIYDMCKSIDREITISDVMLLEKSGGKSGHFVREK